MLSGMVCATRLAPQIAALSIAIDEGRGFTDEFAAICEQCAATAGPMASAFADHTAICAAMCCCKDARSKSGKSKGASNCMEKTFDAVDLLLGHESRYKAEVSYNMMFDPPVPIMQRDREGNDTTIPKKKRGVQQAADYQFPGAGGAGSTMRPDLVVVRDPSKPPSQDNIEKVVEIKFEGDREGSRGGGQYSAYEEIAGSRDKLAVMEEADCRCAKRDQGDEREVPYAVPATETEEQLTENPVETSPNVDPWAVATLVGTGVLFAAAVLCPFDGPVGDVAAGSAFAAAWAATF